MEIERILIVDDDSEQRALYALSAEKVGGWHVDLAASGAEALARIGDQRPDVIVLDVVMPEMSGPEVFARMRALPAMYAASTAETASSEVPKTKENSRVQAVS